MKARLLRTLVKQGVKNAPTKTQVVEQFESILDELELACEQEDREWEEEQARRKADREAG